MKYLKQVYCDPETGLWVARTKLHGKFLGRTVLKACRLAKRGAMRQINYVNNRVWQ